jgi:PAS domain S-box-containing protein
VNLSLKRRIAISFIVANLIVLILAFTVFHFLNSLNKDIEELSLKSNQETMLNEEARISAVLILKYQRRILIQPTTEIVEKILTLCDSFIWQLQKLESIYQDKDIKTTLTKMISYVDSLKTFLNNANIYSRDITAFNSVAELSDKILDSFLEFQDYHMLQSNERDKKIKVILTESKKNMMITLIIAFLGSIILGLVIPGKIALPFKKIMHAIRELQENNFDVTIHYTQKDEIGELAGEMNKMITSFKRFDEIRAERIEVENRKFDVLASITHRYVIVSNYEGKIVYLNNRLFEALGLTSEEIIGKSITENIFPESLRHIFDLALKRHARIENEEITFKIKSKETHEIGEIEDKKEAEEKKDFHGFATVIPIRAKESSLDYYIMVISAEILA